jgi:hypothetical protein
MQYDCSQLGYYKYGAPKAHPPAKAHLEHAKERTNTDTTISSNCGNQPKQCKGKQQAADYVQEQECFIHLKLVDYSGGATGLDQWLPMYPPFRAAWQKVIRPSTSLPPPRQ